MSGQHQCSADEQRAIDLSCAVKVTDGQRIATIDVFFWKDLERAQLGGVVGGVLAQLVVAQPAEVLIFPRSFRHTPYTTQAFTLQLTLALRSSTVSVYNYGTGAFDPLSSPQALPAALASGLTKKMVELALLAKYLAQPHHGLAKRRRRGQRLVRLAAELEKLIAARDREYGGVRARSF